MKYIGNVRELDIKYAASLSELGIDIFNANDAFFNDICHPYDDPDSRDITLNDRRTDIYQNATFCQDGCSYLGMNYYLMVANCKCNSTLFQRNEKNATENNELRTDTNNFKNFKKYFISNLIDFNFEILRCYNLIIQKKNTFSQYWVFYFIWNAIFTNYILYYLFD